MSRPAASAVLVLLLVALGAALATVVPWSVLPGAEPVVDVGRDFTPEQLAREVAFHDEVRPPSYASLVVGLVVSGVLALTPLGARLVSAAARPLGGGWVWQVLLGTLALAVVGRLVTLPMDLRSEVVLRRYDLSTQTWGTWAVDVLKGLGVSVALTGLVLVAVIGLARALPHAWWWAAAAVTALLVVAGSFAYPVLVEPVFNRFEALPAGELRDDLLELAERDGVAVSDVLVADASRRTTALNAYVSGFGSTRRIVVYDTLVERATPAEVRNVVAHELGHAKERDVLKGTLLGALGSAAGVIALALLLSWAPLLRRAGADGVGDPRVIPLVVFVVGVATLLMAPASNLVSRRVEARADVHALELTCDAQTFVDSQKRLAVSNLSDLEPHPVAYAFFASHPSSPQRIALAREHERLRC
jgi:STE24 endopeptidase